MSILKYLNACGVAEQLHVQAMASFAVAESLYKTQVRKYKWLAPIMAWWALRKLPWEANELPVKWWRYDNDVSINGDGWAVMRDGKWVRVSGNELPGEVAVPYGDPSYTGDAYYAEGHHPRSFWARYIWLGWRNRASATALAAGIDAALPAERWVNRTYNSKGELTELVEVYRMAVFWQIITVKKFWIFAVRRNIGYKINNVVNFGAKRAAVTWIPWSLLRWKEPTL